ncbi:hypothetical protein WMY93_014704 [Mugilogobius chulae]|uniref:C-type lectin domain-containing protein n=1 Tax=Mugilogobius chulae TaxID=88201 RepID=A0AAW0NZJ7_9GOBI
MNAPSVAVFLWIFLAKTAVLESAAVFQIRSDVACPTDWTYAFNMKCIRLYPNDTMSQATVTCHALLSDMGVPVDKIESAVVFTVGGTQNGEELWLGHHMESKDKFADKIPACSEDVGTGQCVKLVVTGCSSHCWAPENCETKLPFFCIGDASMLRRSRVNQNDGH